MDSRLYVIKDVLDGITLFYKNAPGKHDQPEHGSWADDLNSEPKVDDTDARAAARTEPVKSPAVDNNAVPKANHTLDVLPVLNDSSNQGYRTKLRSLLPDPDEEEMGIGEDRLMEELIVEQGFNAKPHLVDEAELDKHVADGEIELFRGLKEDGGANYAEAFRSGENVYAAMGRMGSGIYTQATITGADGKVYRGDVTANSYGNVGENVMARGSVIRMSIKKDAKVVSHGDLLREMHAANNEYMTKIKDMESKYGKKIPPEQQKEYNRLQDIVMGITCNPGRFAAARGYDAVMEPQRGMVLVINRGALRVQKTNWGT